ncbi:DNA-binding protein [Actinoplanes sp. NPDC051633]|uniref:DNA-binding protein n=1 Tax=Actinoplanes sp. NPDC051633 TaxID=3155670 RepID=UPI0034320D2A
MGLKGKLYTTGDLADLLGVTRQRAYAISRRKGFPDPFDEWPGGLAVWSVDQVNEWRRTSWRPRAEDPES